MIPQSSLVHFFKEQPASVQTCARSVFSIGWMCNPLRLARGARRRCCSRCLSMAKRTVRRSVRPCLGRTEFAEPRPEGPAVYPSLKQQGDPSSSNSVWEPSGGAAVRVHSSLEQWLHIQPLYLFASTRTDELFTIPSKLARYSPLAFQSR
jgi:hypothetical protein